MPAERGRAREEADLTASFRPVGLEPLASADGVDILSFGSRAWNVPDAELESVWYVRLHLTRGNEARRD